MLSSLVNSPDGDPGLLLRLSNQPLDYLVDCGHWQHLSSALALRIGRLFVSHTHIDHFIGFDALLRHSLFRPLPLHVYGPSGILEHTLGHLRGYVWNLTSGSPFQVVVHELEGQTVQTTSLACGRRFAPEAGPTTRSEFLSLEEGVELRWADVDHGVPCLAYRFTWPGGWHFDSARCLQDGLQPGPWVGQLKTLAQAGRFQEVFQGRPVQVWCERYLGRSPDRSLSYVTDTRLVGPIFDSLCHFVQDSDELWCEANYLESEAHLAGLHGHATAAQAAELARRAGCRELHLFHFSRRYQGLLQEHLKQARGIFPPTWIGRCELGKVEASLGEA